MMSNVIPQLKHDNGKVRLIVDGRPYIGMGAEIRNSSASSVAYMEAVWATLKAMNCNTACVPVYWELVEPVEGEFDFSLVEGLLDGARRHGMRMIPLWFGTWKNTRSSYAPAWVKLDQARFPRAQLAPGVPSLTVSPFSEEALRADARAFARFMAFLREADTQHTVVMVQVENETGLLEASRDHSPAAEQAFSEPIPDALTRLLETSPDRLHEDVRAAWAGAGKAVKGSWAAVFGDVADETFMAWHLARYVDQVAAAGRAEYALPLFVNAWLSSNDIAGPGMGGAKPGEYPSGGPVTRMHEIWRTATTVIDALAPDIYVNEFKDVCARFAREGNPLIIPEVLSATAAATVYWALAEHGALLFAPFGIDGPHPWGDGILATKAPGLPEAYAVLASMMPVIEPYLGTDRAMGILQTGDAPEQKTFAGLTIEVHYPVPLKDAALPAGGLIVQTGELEFLVAGRGFDVRFSDRDRLVDFLAVEDGEFRDGVWHPDRRLNGDDTWGRLLRLAPEPNPVVRRIQLYYTTRPAQ
jgi:hypothetical protein